MLDFPRLTEIAKAHGGELRREADYTGALLEDRAEIVFDGYGTDALYAARAAAVEDLRPTGYDLHAVRHRGFQCWYLRDSNGGQYGEKRVAIRVRLK